MSENPLRHKRTIVAARLASLPTGITPPRSKKPHRPPHRRFAATNPRARSTHRHCAAQQQLVKMCATVSVKRVSPNMARITVEDCLEVVDNRFELVLMASKRARQLSKGAEPVVGADKNDKPTVLALREIAGGRINMDMVDEIDRQEKARAEREALEWAAAELDEDKGGDDI